VAVRAIVLLYGVVCACNAGAWWLSMADEPSHPPFWRTYAITVASFSLNFMTPMVNVGGEPFKIAASRPGWACAVRAGSVVLYQMLHTLGMLLSFLTAVVLGALLLPPHPAILAGLAIAFVALAALIFLLLTGHRRGDSRACWTCCIASRCSIGWRDASSRNGPPSPKWTSRSPSSITPPPSLRAGRGAGIPQPFDLHARVRADRNGCGVSITFAQAYVIGGLTSLVQNVIFVVPFEVGTKEGSLYLVFQLLGSTRPSAYTRPS